MLKLNKKIPLEYMKISKEKSGYHSLGNWTKNAMIMRLPYPWSLIRLREWI